MKLGLLVPCQIVKGINCPRQNISLKFWLDIHHEHSPTAHRVSFFLKHLIFMCACGVGSHKMWYSSSGWLKSRWFKVQKRAMMFGWKGEKTTFNDKLNVAWKNLKQLAKKLDYILIKNLHCVIGGLDRGLSTNYTLQLTFNSGEHYSFEHR